MRLRHRVEAAAASVALRVLRSLGPAAASNLGGAVSRAIGPFLPVSRVADANLRAAMPELDSTARRRVIRDVWDNLGRTVAELPHVGALRRTESGPGWEIEGGEIIEALVARGGPALFLSGHIANWEMFQAAAATYGIQLAALYRAASNPLIDRMIRDLRRGAAGAEPKLFAKGAVGARAALGHLAKGGFLGMLVDQKMNDGIAVPFFGRAAMTAPAAAAFALRHRCPVLMVHAQRVGPARFRILVPPPLELPATGDRTADIAATMTLVNATLESWIRARPGEWLWLHRRWPRPGDAAWSAPVAEDAELVQKSIAALGRLAHDTPRRHDHPSS